MIDRILVEMWNIMELKYCDYCGGDIETTFEPDKVVKTSIKDGVTTHWTERSMVHKYNLKTCPMCKGNFCPNCIPDSEKLCPNCREISNKSDKITSCKHDSVDKKFLRFEEKDSGNYAIYEQTCNDCGVCDLIYEKVAEPNNEVNPSPNIKKNTKICGNCGEEVTATRKTQTGTKTTISNGVINKSSKREVITIEPQCSMCNDIYCFECLAYQRDKYNHRDLYLCPSCYDDFYEKEAKRELSKNQSSMKKSSISPLKILFYIFIIILITAIVFYGR